MTQHLHDHDEGCVLPNGHDGPCSDVPRICRAPAPIDVTWIPAPSSTLDDSFTRALQRGAYVSAVMPRKVS